MKRSLKWLMACFLAPSLLGATGPGAAPSLALTNKDSAEAANASRFPFKQVSPDEFTLGKVTLNKAHRTIAFPAVVNQRNGMVEYAVVTFTGKTHESVFKTEARPEHIHTAMLLLGVESANTNMFPSDLSAPLPGAKVRIEVSWEHDGRQVRRALEDFIVTTNNQKSLSPGPWVYNGSYLNDHRFMAQVDGSIISVHTDPIALVNNPRKGRENDDMQNVNTAALPPNDVTLNLIIKLETGASSASPGEGSATSGEQPVKPPMKQLP